MPESEICFSVDVETSGPIPGEFSLLTIGACNAYDDAQSFACSLKPISDKSVPEAMRITGLSLDDLRENGLDPADALRRFRDWVLETAAGATPVFVGLNAGFDWSFVNYYFHRFLGESPFGFAPLDIKSLYMGATGCSWNDTRSSKMSAALHPASAGSHDALADARFQAELFRLIRSGRSPQEDPAKGSE